ncbi:hypothetical protein [Chitinimonas sp.]|uniref:DUF6985 domain-containing protein n=1 Tax=Chitinimonas sp. TaxID=1934313 RepID=UPI0035B1BAC3
MFGLFSSPTILDVELGELKRSRGMWRGHFSLQGDAAPLIIDGPKNGPDPDAMKLAKSIAGQYPSWRTAIENALAQHLAPYAEAIASGDLPTPEEPLPEMRYPGDVWPHVVLEFVAVMPLDGKPTIEFGYRVTWDDEHTLGARFQDGRLIELCGSVLCP